MNQRIKQRDLDKKKQKRKEIARKKAIRTEKILAQRRASLVRMVKLADRLTNRSDEVDELFEEQHRLFAQKFGRPAEKGDPLFFQPDKDVPTEIDGHYIPDNALRIAELVGLPKDMLYAAKKTRMLIYNETRANFSIGELREWDSALAEYRDQTLRAEGRAKSTVVKTEINDNDWLSELKE